MGSLPSERGLTPARPFRALTMHPADPQSYVDGTFYPRKGGQYIRSGSGSALQHLATVFSWVRGFEEKLDHEPSARASAEDFVIPSNPFPLADVPKLGTHLL